MQATLGLRFFVPQSGEKVLKNWTTTDTVARWAQYIPAVFFGRVIQVSADGKKAEELSPSRLKLLLPFALLGGVAVYFSLQKIALIAAAVMVTTSILGVFAMGRSEAQAEYNGAYVDFRFEQRKQGALLDKAELAEEVNKYAQDIANQASSWLTGDITSALKAFQEQCERGTTTLITHLLSVDEKVFNAAYKKAGNFLMEKMNSREMATAIMAEVVKAAPSKGEDQIERYQTFIERFARRGEYYSGANWTSEICDAVKGDTVALSGIVIGLATKMGSIGKALARGFTASELKQVMNDNRLPIATLGALSAELEANADNPRFAGYTDLRRLCDARLSDAINKLEHPEGYNGGQAPQTEEFLKLKDLKVQEKWIEVSLGAGWLSELAEKIDLSVAVKGFSGDLAEADSGFLTAILKRLLAEGSKEQADIVVNLANTSTLPLWNSLGNTLSKEQVALVQLLCIKHSLTAESVAVVIRNNPGNFAPELLKLNKGSHELMIWKTFVGMNPSYPQGLEEKDALVFFGALPKAFKKAVNGYKAQHEASINRLASAMIFLIKENKQSIIGAFVKGMDSGQKAILGHHLSAEEHASSDIVKYFGINIINSWKALGSVGHGTLYDGFVE